MKKIKKEKVVLIECNHCGECYNKVAIPEHIVGISAERYDVMQGKTILGSKFYCNHCIKKIAQFFCKLGNL